MKISARKMAVVWTVPVVAMLVAFAADRLETWVYYALVTYAIGAAAGLLVPVAVARMAPSMGLRRSLRVVSVAGWAVLGGGIIAASAIVEHRVSWALFPALGLALWPLATWLFTSGQNDAR